MEFALTGYLPKTKDIVRSEIVSTISNYNKKKPTHNSAQSKVDLEKFRLAKEFLKKHQNLLVTKADKGNVTVVMEKTHYQSKCLDLLNDNTTYEVINKDPTKGIEKQTNSIINDWCKAKYITVSMAKNLKTHNSLPAKIYFQPKIHKPNVPLRPIVSNINAQTYKLARFCAGVLSNVVGKSHYHVKDSWSFVEQINNMVIPPDHVLISLDVESLYTNIPTKLALAVIGKNWNSIKDHTTIEKRSTIKAVKLCLDSTCFIHNDTHYKQICGVAMGSPISPVVANLVMENLKQKIISKLPFTLPLYKRYVDDILTCAHKDNVDELLRKFNNYHPRLRFTHELENKGCISFLDTLVINDHSCIITDWYRKNT